MVQGAVAFSQVQGGIKGSGQVGFGFFYALGADPNLVDGIKGIIFIATVFVTIARRKGQVVN